MIYIGCDIELISRFNNKIDDKDFLDIIFSEKEQQYFFLKKHHAKHLAARFCGKEAVIKAFGNAGLDDISYTDIEINTDPNGAAKATLLKPSLINPVIQISLSHCAQYAMAHALIEIKNDSQDR